MTRADSPAAARATAAWDTARAEELRRIAARFTAVADRLEELDDERGQESSDA